MTEEYCIDCEILINIPRGGTMDRFEGLVMGPKTNVPVKYKSGWKCSKCAKK